MNSITEIGDKHLMALRRTIKVGDAWCYKSIDGQINIFIVKEIIPDNKANGSPIVLTDITGLFRSAISRLTYFSMSKKATLLTSTDINNLRNMISSSLTNNTK